MLTIIGLLIWLQEADDCLIIDCFIDPLDRLFFGPGEVVGDWEGGDHYSSI